MNNDQEDFYCEGLQSGYAASAPKGEVLIHIDEADKSMLPLFCPDCGGQAYIRKPTFTDKRDHYVHKPVYSEIYRRGESELHRQCKEEIYAEMKERFPEGNWQTELVLNKNKEKGFAKVRPDISGVIDGKNVTIEIQYSSLGIATMFRRMVEYKKRGWYVLWIVPLKKPLSGKRFRPRLFEFILHQMYFGKVFYWMKGMGRDVEGVYFKRLRYTTEVKEFYKEGELMTVGGHKKTYSFLRRPISAPQQFDITNFLFQTTGEWQASKKYRAKKNTPIIPARSLFTNFAKWWDKEPADLENEYFEMLRNAKLLEEDKEESVCEVPVVEPNVKPIELLDPYPVS
ncbi:MAG: competence protein CoiA family protein [Bacteroidota bacterium]